MTRSKMLMAATALLITPFLPAQPNNAGPTIYGSTSSFHVPDETRAAYETWLKDKYQKFAEAMLKEDPTLVSFGVTRVIYGGVKEPEANFFLTIFQEGIPKPRTELQNKVAQQLFGKSYAEFTREAMPLRQRLGQTLSRRVATTGPVAVETGDVVRLDYKKISPNRMGDYLQLERDYLRLREAQAKAGKMKSWAVYSVVLPQGTEREYDAFTVHIGKDLEQVLTWGQGMGEIAAQLNPPLNVTGMALRSNDLSKTVRVETRVSVMRVTRK